MSYKVLVIVPFPLDEEGISKRRLQAESTKLSRNIVFDYRAVKASCLSFMSDHDWALMDMACFEAGLSAQDEGYDAVVIDSTADSGLGPLRSVLDIPIIAPGHISCLYALMLAKTFGILAMNEVGVFSHKQWLRERYLSEFCSAVEAIGSKTDISNLMTGKEQDVFPLIQAAAERAMEKGAQVIILGSTTMHQAGDWLNEALPIPVINPGPLTYKIVETVLSLDHSHSRIGFPSPEEPRPDMVHAMLNAAAIIEKQKTSD